MSEMVKISIPKYIYEKIKDRIQGTSFKSVDEYVALMLENEFPEETQYSKEEEELIRERLRRLGYIE